MTVSIPQLSFPGVLHVIDSLEVGGAETVAVNLANHLPRAKYRPFLCNTRQTEKGDGLASLIQPEVGRLSLERSGRFDFNAVRRFTRFIRENNIHLLHLHGTSLFLGRLASLLPASRVKVIWHDHYGRCELNDRPVRLYRMATAGAAGIITVNRQLADWACQTLRVPSDRVWYVPNFVVPAPSGAQATSRLPGVPGQRIVCLANLRPQKDHSTLLRAMASVHRVYPRAHLLIAGAPIDTALVASLERQASELGIADCVTFMGQVKDAARLLAACDIGVLSSVSEGLPLSLLEYAWAGLPSVATSVGQCPEVLDFGRAGTLVPPSSPEELAVALIALLDSEALRKRNGNALLDFVQQRFNPDAVMKQIAEIYDQVLAARN